ncbi:methylmalonyl-CoA mutase, partial [Rhizobiaceae sp. 2RAB30]
MMIGGKLLEDIRFEASGEAQWRALADKALAGASFDEALVSRTDDAIAVKPLYGRAKDAMLLPRANPTSRWTLTQRVDDPDPARANRQAQDDVAQGATGLSLVFEGAPNAFGYGLPANPEALAKTLEGIDISRTHLRVDVHPMSRASID